LPTHIGGLQNPLRRDTSDNRIKYISINRVRSQLGWRAASGQPDAQPSIEDVEHDLGLALYPIRELAVLKIASVFEIFVQCWALNMFLALLESGQSLSSEQEKLQRDFSPIHSPKTLTPGLPRILRAFPAAHSGLEGLAHVKTDPRSGAELEEPLEPQLNSLQAILFWRDFRNLVVHQSGLTSLRFRAKHVEFFEAMRRPYSDRLRALAPMTRLQLPDVVFYAMISVHHRAGIFLNSVLQQHSVRRGIVFLPESGREEPTAFDPSLPTLPLLIEGDEAESLRWVTDKNFRNQVLSTLQQSGDAGAL
jgi:hypothetical protein